MHWFKSSSCLESRGRPHIIKFPRTTFTWWLFFSSLPSCLHNSVQSYINYNNSYLYLTHSIFLVIVPRLSGCCSCKSGKDKIFHTEIQAITILTFELTLQERDWRFISGECSVNKSCISELSTTNVDTPVINGWNKLYHNSWSSLIIVDEKSSWVCDK